MKIKPSKIKDKDIRRNKKIWWPWDKGGWMKALHKKLNFK
jgi:hypothetical protein